MLRLLFICILSCSVCTVALTQDTLLLMNGRELDCNIIDDSGTVFIFELKKKNGKVKVHEVHKNDVFSVTKRGQPEYILYTQNEFLGDIYTTDELRFYLAGENDARENFTAWPTFFVGFALCGAAAYAGEDGVLTAIVPPLVYTIVQLVPKIKIKEKYMSDPGYKYNDMYADGFEPPARSRKIFRALEGGLSGSAIGVTAWLLLGKK